MTTDLSSEVDFFKRLKSLELHKSPDSEYLLQFFFMVVANCWQMDQLVCLGEFGKQRVFHLGLGRLSFSSLSAVRSIYKNYRAIYLLSIAPKLEASIILHRLHRTRGWFTLVRFISFLVMDVLIASSIPIPLFANTRCIP